MKDRYAREDIEYLKRRIDQMGKEMGRMERDIAFMQRLFRDSGLVKEF